MSTKPQCHEEEDDDEWAMFGSDDSEEEDQISVEGSDTNIDGAITYLDSDALINQEIVNDDVSSTLRMKKLSKSFTQPAIQDITLFTIQALLKANKTISLSQRFFAMTLLLPKNDNQRHISNETAYLDWTYIYTSWVQSLSFHIQQRSVNIMSPEREFDPERISEKGNKQQRETANNYRDITSISHSCQEEKYRSDAASLFRCFAFDNDHLDNGGAESTSIYTYEEESCHERYRQESDIRRQLVPGGFLLLSMCFITTAKQNSMGQNDDDNDDEGKALQNKVNSLESKDPSYLLNLWRHDDDSRNPIFTDAVWDVETASIMHSSTKTILGNDRELPFRAISFFTIHLVKRPCPINTSSCPWRGNGVVKASNLEASDECSNQNTSMAVKEETWIQYERRILAESTISCSISERNYVQRQSTTMHEHGPGSTMPANTRMSPENIQKGIKALQQNGFLVLRNLYSIDDVNSLSSAVLSDFDLATSILYEKYSIDIINPGGSNDNKCSPTVNKKEPLNYKEMAMREDLRVDLRDGPNMTKSRQNQAVASSNFLPSLNSNTTPNDSTILDINTSMKDCLLRIQNSDKRDSGEASMRLRYHPAVLEIIQGLFNPHYGDGETIFEETTTGKDTVNNQSVQQPLYKGNFGRWNFSGSGPDGSPQPLKIGQIGSVISLPGAADQAIHADTPHLFETDDCLPCHYSNLFILGDCSASTTKDECKSNDLSVGEFDLDGIFTGNSPIGGTAFIHGSHRLSIAARLTAEDNLVGRSAASAKKEAKDEMYRRIIRPSLQKGDALIFDTRCLHFGLSNQSNYNRPMMYINYTHSWFHDPKNWNNNESIFDGRTLNEVGSC